jgi:pimeloyl-ACP methyl ester carboxylesterase
MRLAYKVRGSGPTMLIYNGLLSTDLHWRFWVPHYADRFSVLTWDYPGHGDSPRPDDLASVGIAPFADAGHDVLVTSRAARPAIVCGLSMGVQSALEHYRAHRADVRALVLVCGTYGHPLARLSSSERLRRLITGSFRVVGRAGRLARAAMWPFFATPVGRELAYLTGGAHRGKCPQEVLDELYAHLLRLDADVIAAAVTSYLDHTAEDLLDAIDVPTLIIAGDRDQLTPASIAERMHARIRGSSLHVIRGHTHLAQVECPDEVHAVVDRFLAERSLATAP